MKICQDHWDKLRAAIQKRGLDHLGAQNSAEVMRTVTTELEGRGAENEYDPLLSCNFMIWNRGLEVCGPALMNEKGGCPICEALRLYAEWWIEGPAEVALQEAKKRGLVP